MKLGPKGKQRVKTLIHRLSVQTPVIVTEEDAVRYVQSMLKEEGERISKSILYLESIGYEVSFKGKVK